MKYFWLGLIFLLVVAGLWYAEKSRKQSRLSPAQSKVETEIGEGIIHLQDSYKNFQADVDFTNKQALVATVNGGITYVIMDILQPFNLDDQGDQEYPFLLEANYPDGKKLAYLVIARKDKEKNKFLAVDQTVVGNPAQIKDIHSLNNREVVIDAQWGEGTNKEDVKLAYTFQNDKIVPDKNNVDISQPKPKPQPSSAPSDTPKKSSDNTNNNSGDKGKVALTFDDGPGVHTPEILAVLSDKAVKATFFMIGENAQSRSDYVKKVHDAGHEIGNHTYDHQDLKKLSYDAQYEEINKTNNIIKGIIGLSPHYMRPPYGNYNDDTKSVLSALAMEKVLWNVDTRDWSGKSADDIQSSALEGIKDEAIILMHDGVANSSETAKALPGIINEIKSRGYTMVKISEL